MSSGGVQAGSPCVLILAGVAIGLLVSTSVMKLTGVSVEERGQLMRVVQLQSLKGPGVQAARPPGSATGTGSAHPRAAPTTTRGGARDRLILVNTMVRSPFCRSCRV